MRRKLLINLLIAATLVFTFGISAFAQYTDVKENTSLYYAVSSLSKAGIIKGYSDGTFKPNAIVTRAEFAKMAVYAIGKEDDADLVKNSTIFSDVPAKHWATGYINIAVKNGIITGYADGTFKPEEKINFAQVVTILLRTLGYTSDKMSGVWPQNYIEKAKSLEITKEISLKTNDKVSRGNIAIMLERAINTKGHSSNSTLGESSNIGTKKTCIITNSYDLDNSLQKGLVQTDEGDYRAESFDGASYLGKKVNLLIDSDNVVISAQSVEQDSKVLMVENMSGNKITYLGVNGEGSIELSDSMLFYYAGEKSTFENIRNSITIGSVIALGVTEGNDSIYEYGVLIDPPTGQPVVVKNGVIITDKNIGSINISNKDAITVIKNGKKIGFADIEQYDVVYLVKNIFNSSKQIILVYDEKFTGTYDEALPDKASVSSIMILGEEKKIETSSAASKLNESTGAFKIGDEITVLIGKSGKIVDVMTPYASDVSNYAVVVNSRKGVSTEADTKGETVYYVKLFKIDGTTQEYETDEEQSNRKNKLVQFDVKDEKVHITPVSGSAISGRINIDERKIGTSVVAQDAVILDIKESVDSGDTQVVKVKWQNMPEADLEEDNVILAETGGGFGDVQLLVLDNYTQAGQYGVLVSKSQGASTYSYAIMSEGELLSFNNIDSKFYGVARDVVFFKQDSSELTDMKVLNPKASASKIQAIDTKRIKIADKIYKLSSDVQVYELTTGQPIALSINALINGTTISGITLYSGNKTGFEGMIKIITITIRK